MDDPGGKSRKGGKTALTKAASNYVAGLSNEHRMLVVLKKELYDGSWEPMLDDLQNRLDGKRNSRASTVSTWPTTLNCLERRPGRDVDGGEL